MAHRFATRSLAVLILIMALVQPPAHSGPSHLVFEGGGVRGIAYAGALEVLEESGALDSVESTSGTSVGGLTAVLYAVGYSPRELTALLADLKIQQFNDGRWLFAGGLARTAKRYGWYRGDRFEAWIADAIERKTGNRDLTFRGLHTLRIASPRYKDPTVFAADLTQQRTVFFSHETAPDMPLHLAARITMSVPLYFGAVFLDSAMRPVRSPSAGAAHVFVDGGIAANYPLSYYHPKDSFKRALGFKLERPEQMAAGPASRAGVAAYRIKSLRDYVGALYNFSIEAANPDPPSTSTASTIYISTQGIGARVRRMSSAEIEQLVESGRTAARAYLQMGQRTD